MFYENVQKILRLDNFNKLKEFIIRLYRNNLFLNNRGHNCPIDSIENISLIFLWKFMYTEKFSNGIPNKKAFAHSYKRLISVVAEMHISNLLGASEIVKILNVERKI